MIGTRLPPFNMHTKNRALQVCCVWHNRGLAGAEEKDKRGRGHSTGLYPRAPKKTDAHTVHVQGPFTKL